MHSRLGGDNSHHASLNTQEDPSPSRIHENETQQAQIKFLEIKRFVFQLDNIVEFCDDDASDVEIIVRMIE